MALYGGNMPKYDYKCNKCEHEFEVDHKMVEVYTDGCPKCKHKKVRRILLAPGGFVLRGDGWARDGYSKTQGKINKIKEKL